MQVKCKDRPLGETTKGVEKNRKGLKTEPRSTPTERGEAGD